MGSEVELGVREAQLRQQVLDHLHGLGFMRDAEGRLQPPSLDKDAYRRFHQWQREDKLASNMQWLEPRQHSLLKWFADGCDISPQDIKPELELIRSKTWQSDLFRMAALHWRVPVSEGYGRRMRFLVWDRSNSKLIGIIALGDAVFNQAARDTAIGWDHNRRSMALVNIMDAYVLGAVPPYSQLLGGKLVASLVRSREVVDAFASRYSKSIGLISNNQKNARLLAVTTTSALGRSSVYNRHKLNGSSIFEPIGYTSGWGHFHFSGAIFDALRSYLQLVEDDYAEGFEYGSGPNWKIRVIRRALERLGLDTSLARHGFVREVFICRVATNAEAVLRGDKKRALYGDLPRVREVGAAAVARWVIPRSERDPRYREWRALDMLDSIHGSPPKEVALRAENNGLGD